LEKLIIQEIIDHDRAGQWQMLLMVVDGWRKVLLIWSLVSPEKED
jgi:hypothetical protein